MTYSGQFDRGWPRRGKAHGALMVAALSTAALLFAPPARAEFIEFTFSGDITIVTGTPPEPWEEAQVGDEWTLSYIFDSETPDMAGGPQGAYAIESLAAGIDEEMVDSVGLHEIYVETLGDIYRVSFSELTNGAFGDLNLHMSSDFPDGDALPLTLDLEDFLPYPASFFFMTNELESFNIEGYPLALDIQIVPAPGTLIVVVGTLLGRCLSSRRRDGAR